MTLQQDSIEKVISKLRNVRMLHRIDGEKPHKLLFLLTLARMYERNTQRNRLFPLDKKLISEFNEVVKEFCPNIPRNSILIEYPFFHLTSDGMWSLMVREGKQKTFESYINSPNMRLTLNRLIETAQGGQLEESIDHCFRDLNTNKRIQVFLSEWLFELNKKTNMPIGGRIREEQSQYSLFTHEAKALTTIERHVKSHGLGETLCNLELYDNQSNRYFETDLVVISRFGVYVVELKHWSGRIEVRPNSWIQNRSFFKKDPHKINNFKAKLLRGLYDRKFPSFPSLYFESVVVLTNPDIEVIGFSIPKTTENNPTFESIDRFLQYIKWQRENKEATLTSTQCQAFSKYIQNLNTVGTPRDFLFPGYEIVERLYQYEDRAEVVARRTDIRHRRLSRLRIFFLKSGDHRAREKATATLNAVEKIGDHANILKVWDIPNENNYLVEGSDWSESGTLRDILDRSGPLNPGKALKIATGIARGLEAAHSQYVVHRSLSPENILIVNDTPKLMNFDLSFQLEDNRITVIPDASKLKRSPYIAPEIYISETVPEATADLFSLGVILYEMIVGRSPFGCSTDLEHTGGKLADIELIKINQVSDMPKHVTDLIAALVRQNPSDRIADASKVIDILENSTTLPNTAETNPRLNDGVQLGLYNIQSFERSGAEAQIYRAAGVRGKNVALKLFNYDVPLPRVVDEQSYAASANHPSLVQVDSYSQWSDGRYFIAFDWVSERSLRDEINDGVRPDIDNFVRGAEQLLDALTCLHLNTEEDRPSPILHNDIKPENILIGNANRLVLIDFGAASEPHVGTYEGTEGYVAPDLRLGKDRKYCIDGDLYALSISLYEWLLGSRPTEVLAHSLALPPALVEWLQKGASSDATDRYPSAKDMKEALKSVTTKSEPPKIAPTDEQAQPVTEEDESVELERIKVISASALAAPNPFVPYLNSLHSRNAANENALAESQARSPFFNFIHVAHPITDIIFGMLVGDEKKHVVLTGHAGDGKSTIAVDIYKRLAGHSLNKPLTKALKRREDQMGVSLVKDFSEWSPGERSNLMAEMLADEGPRYLLISNTGTLLDTFKRQENAFGNDWVGVESDLLSAMNTIEPTTVPFHSAKFVLINVAMMDNLAIARQIFELMLADDRWEPCDTAQCREKCPICRNVSLMRANLPFVCDRLFLAYRRMYEYGTRLTLRQLCAHMAYMITSGLDYDDISKMAERAKPPLMAEFMFFNRFFGDNGNAPDPLALQLRGVQAVREQRFGSQPSPTWERHLWLRSSGRSFQLNSAKVPDDFETLRRYGAGLLIDESLLSADARNQIRRAVFFLHHFFDNEGQKFLRSFLCSNMILDFVRWQQMEEETLNLQESSGLHRRIMHVLQEHFTGVRLPEGASPDRQLFVTLSRHSHDVRQSAQVVLARYPEDDFRISLRKTLIPAGGIRRDLFLEGPPSTDGLNLPLPLPFLDYVILRNLGEIGEALQASYVDRLERFKGQLIQYATGRNTDDLMLVRLRTNHTFRRQIFSVRNGRLEVTDA